MAMPTIPLVIVETEHVGEEDPPNANMLGALD